MFWKGWVFMVLRCPSSSIVMSFNPPCSSERTIFWNRGPCLHRIESHVGFDSWSCLTLTFCFKYRVRSSLRAVECTGDTFFDFLFWDLTILFLERVLWTTGSKVLNPPTERCFGVTLDFLFRGAFHLCECRLSHCIGVITMIISGSVRPRYSTLWPILLLRLRILHRSVSLLLRLFGVITVSLFFPVYVNYTFQSIWRTPFSFPAVGNECAQHFCPTSTWWEMWPAVCCNLEVFVDQLGITRLPDFPRLPF